MALPRRAQKFIFGVGEKDTAHMTDECIRINALVKGVEVVKDFLTRLDGHG
jgi:acetylornithine deacetylase/succinyl-diaminopimelate desuccinylase-like protein